MVTLRLQLGFDLYLVYFHPFSYMEPNAMAQLVPQSLWAHILNQSLGSNPFLLLTFLVFNAYISHMHFTLIGVNSHLHATVNATDWSMSIDSFIYPAG